MGSFPELKRGRIDVWFANIDRRPSEIRAWEAVLSPEETDRAKRFRFSSDCSRYVAQHGMLRSLLSRYLGCGPQDVEIRTGAKGKPCLPVVEDEVSLQFSMSHSDAYVAFAFARDKSIGVDIERIRALPEMMGIIERHFTVREKEAMLACPEDGRLDLFYRFWTRKEALLKAQGEGLLKPLDSIEVTRNGEPLRPWKVFVVGCPTNDGFWVADLDGPAGFAASVAATGCMDKISVHYFQTRREM